MIKLLSLAAALSFAAAANAVEGPAWDAGAVLRSLGRESGAVKVGSPKMGRHLHWLGGKERVVLAPGTTQSGVLKLSSTEVVEECDFDPRGGMRCRQTFGRTVRRSVRLVLEGRPASNPAETFDVWLMGFDLSVDVIGGPTRYETTVKGDTIFLKAVL